MVLVTALCSGDGDCDVEQKYTWYLLQRCAVVKEIVTWSSNTRGTCYRAVQW